jgi:hypothetical protein
MPRAISDTIATVRVSNGIHRHGSVKHGLLAICAASTALHVVLHAPLARAQAPAVADESDACFTSAERAQPLIRQKRLREARAELEMCARDVCPRIVRTDCRNWLADVVSEQPSIVIAPHEVRGTEVHDVHGVRATIDGAIAAPNADANPVMIDPGPHRLHVERAGAEAIEQDIDIREGEKDRVVHVYWRVPTATVPVVTSPPAETAPVVYVLGGLGVAAVGAGTYLEITSLLRYHDLSSSCGQTRTCKQGDVDTAHNFAIGGDVTLGAGFLLLAVAGYFYFTRPSTNTSSRRDHLTWAIDGHPRGFAASLRGSW